MISAESGTRLPSISATGNLLRGMPACTPVCASYGIADMHSQVSSFTTNGLMSGEPAPAG